MKKYGYVRVSTKEQNEQRQLDLMKKYGIRKSDIFIDKLTGKNFDRPSYQSGQAPFFSRNRIIEN
ncbi:recombinase family protein [Cetobacterium sp.]|uniref:recombinase family protein n=1 Tax=Cetobacterium sp. TaxID=2071632 RepID=UPI002FC66BCC